MAWRRALTVCSQINLLQQSIGGSWVVGDGFGDGGVYTFTVRKPLLCLNMCEW